MGSTQSLSVLSCMECSAVTPGDLDQMRALSALCAQCRWRTNSLSLFRRTKLGNRALSVLLCAKGHRSQDIVEVIDLRTQTKFVAKVRAMLVLLIPAQDLDSRPSSPHIFSNFSLLKRKSSISFFLFLFLFEIPNKSLNSAEKRMGGSFGIKLAPDYETKYRPNGPTCFLGDHA